MKCIISNVHLGIIMFNCELHLQLQLQLHTILHGTISFKCGHKIARVPQDDFRGDEVRSQIMLYVLYNSTYQGYNQWLNS